VKSAYTVYTYKLVEKWDLLKLVQD
jgi:hypothetical protein